MNPCTTSFCKQLHQRSLNAIAIPAPLTTIPVSSNRGCRAQRAAVDVDIGALAGIGG
ncbi:MAG: hypothetical protein RMY63_16035 [Nostoc sp. ChiQUE01b]|nr:hypothetical protein [Nostoc sp. ChiQUE01b]